MKEAVREHQQVKNTRIFLNAHGSPLPPIGFESAWGKVMRMLVERTVLEKPLRLLDPRAKAYADHDHAL